MSFHQSSAPDDALSHPCSISLWVNHGHPIMVEVVKAIWDSDVAAHPHDRIIKQIIVTHMDEFHKGYEHASYSEVEGEFDSTAAYIAWALAFAIKHEINTILPGRYAEALIAASADFKAAGITVLHSATVAEGLVMQDRPALYRRLQECFHGDIVPDFFTWEDGYKMGIAEVVERAKTVAFNSLPVHRPTCVMPAAGRISKGFFQFVDSLDPQQQLEQPEQRVITVEDFAAIAHSLALRNQKSRQWVVMEYMPEVVYSVDCLAWNGQVVAHVIREKVSPGPGHVVSENEFIQRHVEIIAKDFGLSGIFNAKFLVDSQGRLKLLSAAPRIVGGIGLSILAGVNLPWLWLKMHASSGAFGNRMPKPKIGTRLDSILCSVLLPGAAQPVTEVDAC